MLGGGGGGAIIKEGPTLLGLQGDVGNTGDGQNLA